MRAWPTSSCCCSNRSARRQRRSKAPGTGVVLEQARPQTQARRAATHRADLVCPAPTGTTGPLFMRQPEGHRGQAPATWQHGPCRRRPWSERLPHSEATPSWGTAPCAAPCLSVCLLWSEGSIRQVARGGCAVAERPAAQHPGASWALRAPPFIYSPQGGEHFDHCC